MSGTVAAIARIIPNSCHATHCNKDKCRVDLAEAPPVRVIVDMDCDALSIPNNWKRCDYLFVGEESNETWVAPIELKSGKLSVSAVSAQLEGGTRMANMWLPQGVTLQFAPVLAHGKKSIETTSNHFAPRSYNCVDIFILWPSPTQSLQIVAYLLSACGLFEKVHHLL